MKKERFLNKYVDLRTHEGRRINANSVVVVSVLAALAIVEAAWAVKAVSIILGF